VQRLHRKYVVLEGGDMNGKEEVQEEDVEEEEEEEEKELGRLDPERKEDAEAYLG
jgi:hypothetical protein